MIDFMQMIYYTHGIFHMMKTAVRKNLVIALGVYSHCHMLNMNLEMFCNVK